jgi:prephenate dehydratase
MSKLNKQSNQINEVGKKIAIQGYAGSFHQVAALQYFGNETTIVPCATFRELIKLAANKKETHGGIMAIENSIAGSILPNYTLLQKSNLHIVGEVYLRIEQNLLVYPGVRLNDIKEVHSHPMALLQCVDFLEQHNWKLIETEDTALSAQHIHKKRSPHIAGIASKLAADLFDLEILASNIHTQKNNYTRFLVLQKDNVEVEQADKASINFQTNHTKGSLAKVLSKVSEEGINLSKLQSMPIAGTNFKYSFHADLEFENINQLNKALKSIEPLTENVRILGIYKNGNVH